MPDDPKKLEGGAPPAVSSPAEPVPGAPPTGGVKNDSGDEGLISKKAFDARMGNERRKRDRLQADLERERKEKAEWQRRFETVEPKSDDPDEILRDRMERIDKKLDRFNESFESQRAQNEERARNDLLHAELNAALGRHPKLKELGIEDVAAREFFMALADDGEVTADEVVNQFASRFEGIGRVGKGQESSPPAPSEDPLSGEPAEGERPPRRKLLDRDDPVMKMSPRDRENELFRRTRTQALERLSASRSRVP